MVSTAPELSSGGFGCGVDIERSIVPWSSILLCRKLRSGGFGGGSGGVGVRTHGYGDFVSSRSKLEDDDVINIPERRTEDPLQLLT
jgi:hypothetical protein